MNPVLRGAWAFIAFFGTYVFIWIMTLLLPLEPFEWIGNLVALAAAIAVARYTWVRADGTPTSVAGAIGYGTMLCGGMGFAAGFFGPMIFAPQANQGPLLGIFITGPAGVLVGALAGLAYGLARSRREPQR